MSMSCNDQENIEPNVQQGDDLLSAALKKKAVKSKNSRRKRTWIDKLNKGERKQPTKKEQRYVRNFIVCSPYMPQ
jgi:hypothetical protein